MFSLIHQQTLKNISLLYNQWLHFHEEQNSKNIKASRPPLSKIYTDVQYKPEAFTEGWYGLIANKKPASWVEENQVMKWNHLVIVVSLPKTSLKKKFVTEICTFADMYVLVQLYDKELSKLKALYAWE